MDLQDDEVDEAQARLDRAWRRRAETLIGDSRPHGRPGGRMEDEIRAIQAEAVDELAVLDELLAGLARRRLALTRTIRDCHRTLMGTTEFCRKTRGRVTLPDKVRPAPDGVIRVPGPALRTVVLDVLRALGSDARIVELNEMLLAQQMVPAASNPLQAIWNALRTLQRQGLVEQVGRGRYRSVAATRAA